MICQKGPEDLEPRAIRWRKIALSFQGASSAFDPVYRVGDQVTFFGRLDSYDDLWRSLYLVHGDVAPPAAPRTPALLLTSVRLSVLA